MYRIQTTHYGFRLTFGGLIDAEEMLCWKTDFAAEVEKQTEPYSVFVDMRTLAPLAREGQLIMQDGQRFALERGMQRSVVILNNPATTQQFRRIAGDSGIHRNERYLNAFAELNWEQVGLDWVERAIEPESNKARAAAQ